ncbi:MAG: ATP-binding protein [Monoglobaceae bacterium]
MDVANIITGIEKRAAESIKAMPGDYVVDGLLYCGKCHTPKQGEYEMPWGIVRPPVLCQCEVERRKKEEEETKHREFLERVDRMRRVCFQIASSSESNTLKMAKWTFEADNGRNDYISNLARNYVKNFPEMREKGKGLLFYGKVGRGKTFIAACIANALLDKGYPVYMTNFASLTNTINGMYEGKQEYIDGLSKFSLLIIDDLAAERDTEYMNEVVHNVIDSRCRSGLPMIVTTNLTGEELKSAADIGKKRIYSRLFEMCIPVEVKGEDLRREKLRNDFAEYKDMLGL